MIIQDNKAKALFNSNADLFKNIDLVEATNRLYQLLLGFSKDEILGHSKVEKRMNKDMNKKSFQMHSENGIREFHARDQAKNTQKRIIEQGKADAFDRLIEECYPEGISKTQLNDLLWFESNWIYETLGMQNPYKDKEEGFEEEASKKSASKKVTAENMDLDDIEAEDNKDEVQEEIEKINEKPTEEIFSETTPEQYFEDALAEDKVDTINEVVSRCIDKFSEKFKDFDKYNVEILSYNTKVLGDYKPTEEEMVEDKELNANAILQVILAIRNNADESEMKKALAVFSVTNGELHWTGTIRGENDQIVAFTEEGLDALFEVEEVADQELEDII